MLYGVSQREPARNVSTMIMTLFASIITFTKGCSRSSNSSGLNLVVDMCKGHGRLGECNLSGSVTKEK